MSDQKKEVALFSETLKLSVLDQGKGQAFLILHGGAGPASVFGLAEALSKVGRAIVPTYPGFNLEPRPDWFKRIDDLVLAFLALIEKLDLSDVIVIGNSVGGWIAAEMALRHSPRISRIVFLNAVAIDTGSPDKKITDPMAVPPEQRLSLSYHNPQKFASLPSGPQLSVMAENQRALRVYAGETLHDATLRPRLSAISIPTLFAWGESDRIVDVEYGRLFAESIPGALFEIVRDAGHFPQIERLDEVLRLVDAFTTSL